MISQFSPKVSEILAFSREEANRLASRSVGPEHLLLAMLRDREGTVKNAFEYLNVNLETVKRQLEDRVRDEETKEPLITSELVLNQKASNILKLAVLEARLQHTKIVDIEHLLLAMLHDQVNNGAKNVLEMNNMNYNDTSNYFEKRNNVTHNGLSLSDEDEEEIDRQRSSSNKNINQTATAQNQASGKTPVLDNFSTDLTLAASEGKLDPVVGREKEIMRVVEILCRRKKNNPILIGEPGVGKSAIVEGLAQLIAQKKTSPVLFNKRVVNLDMTSIVAGTKYRGQFEERIKALLKELEMNPNIIVFIDEIHTMIGAGSTPGSMDAANIMKPALARGAIQCIGATTLDEYRNSIEKDGALERRFQKVIVNP
ncbi:MAG: ATP-dependent Clp protease ATP-binding subunit, partial [Prevotella sp.]|nr:ATP-dependent Clp protease ATP-binding subunit [Prevotella sp.]